MMVTRTDPHTRQAHWPLWLAALVGALLFAALFYPGAMSFDAAYVWSQARGAATTNIQGVGTIWLWRAANALIPGPALIFLAQLALLWSGLVLVAQTLTTKTVWRIAFVFAVALAPVAFVLFAHVWTDIMLIACLTFALGAMLHAGIGANRRWLIAALPMICLPLTLRHNALPATIPLFVYFAYLWIDNTQCWKRSILAGVALAILAQCMSMALEHTVDQRRTMFAATAQWDLAAISVADREMLLPAESVGAGMTLDDLAQALMPYSNTPLFERTRAGMRQPFLLPDDPLNARIRDAWLNAIVTHPRAWLAHRARVTSALFGTRPRAWPAELVYYDGEFAFDGNPAVTANTTTVHRWCMQIFEALRDTAVLAAWPYLVIGIFSAVVAWRRRLEFDMTPAWIVLASGALYAAPLLVIAPSTELRYTGWTCVCALIAAALVAAPARHRRLTSDAYRPVP